MQALGLISLLLYRKQTNASIIKTYKNENKSTKFHLEFLLEKYWYM